MFHPNQQVPLQVRALAVQDPSMLNPMDVRDHGSMTTGGFQNREFVKIESIPIHTKKLQDEVEKLGYKIRDHEENIIFLKSLKNNLDESILDIQVSIGKYHSTTIDTNENSNHVKVEDNTVEQILKQEKSAASLLCQLNIHHKSQASNLPFTKDVLGIVATLGKVDNDNLSRLLSAYVGLETMTAIVCKTFEGVKALETYDKEGKINKSAGLHGLGPTLGKHLEGSFIIICLESLSAYDGGIVIDDPQRKLDLKKPKLNGECPAGFIGFAVNMIDLDYSNLSYRTPDGHGLRETLFYNLFSRLQVYKTRSEMLRARPCIRYGALSLDGGMIKSSGLFCLGDRKEVEVRFGASSKSTTLPHEIMQAEDKLKYTRWEKERIVEEMQREELLLNQVRISFEAKKQEFVKFLAESSTYAAQQQGSRNTTPR